ncbi:T9SS type B sorting domain-containing protein [Flavobacterium sp. NRK F10]|uniref:T9SS type B sorting domain-containing protein n=1 Tax=Flavobacterium sp. NRK F10 TaxID=2954931 RepID=UPI002090703D|nr:T9SS type B sorting domain-containing protein [Flavobacterium sp. NRK F10]MCO6174475.1 T9SS type B sorting domain-containing protein [Flavobacterium sp. NRK F10]
MKRLFLKIVLLVNVVSFSQVVTIDDSSYTADDLVSLLLNTSCVEFANATFSSNQSVAYFTNNGSAFPIQEGIVIRSGNVSDTQGNYTGANLGSTTLNGGSDAFLQGLSDLSSGTTESIIDLAYLQFDFVSVANSFNFNFLFASNEYGDYQCLSNDIFAFELIDLVTNSITNLAVVPNTTTPVSVKTIKNSIYNTTCSSTNPGLFAVYNVDDPGASTINMRGYTVVLSASSAIIPNHPYRLKMVVADYLSSNYDSAVFIGAGSFTTDFDLGPDQIICSGDQFLLDTGLDSTYTFQWLQDGGVIPNETGSAYTVTEPGIYEVIIDKGGCHIEESITFHPLSVTVPQNLFTCDSGATTYSFDLTLNDENYLGIDNIKYDIFYYASMADVTADNPISQSELTAFQSSGQTIYVRIFNIQTGNFCDALYSFDLVIDPPVVAGTEIVGDICDELGTSISYDLSLHDPDVVNGQTGNFVITYYNSESDAFNGENSINNVVAIPAGTSTIVYWIRIAYANNSSCFDITNVEIMIHPLPLVDSISDIVECSNTILPVITNGTYFSLPNGSGLNLGQGGPGSYIEDSGTYYIFAGPDANGCTNQTSFQVTFIDEYGPRINNCGRFVVPVPLQGIGGFYTDFGGPNGTGTLIPSGTVYSNSSSSTIVQSIYYYAEVNGVLCRDDQFDIYIHPMPLVDEPDDVTYCDSYVLPSLSNGNYFTQSGGNGTALFAGDVITANQAIYVYNQLNHINSDGSQGFCSLENMFQVNIVDTSQFTDIHTCGSFMLPDIDFGGYFNQPGGQGSSIDPNVPLTSSQVVYYYAETTLSPNCTENLNYNITIYDAPAVDQVPNGNYCGEYIFPSLTNGTYYRLSGGPTVAGQQEVVLPAKIEIGGTYPSGTYYVYNETSYTLPDGSLITCTNEHAFTIVVRPFPGLDQAINRNECMPYSLSQPQLGTYYTEQGGPNGSGQIVDPNTIFTSTETFYLYYEDPVTGCTIDKEFQILFKGLNLPDYPDVARCDSYMLPPLINPTPNPESVNYVKYYFSSGGDPADEIDFSNYVFTPNNTPQTVYVYGINTDNHLAYCTEERSFIVTVLETPVLPDYSSYDNQNYCGEFTLPVLPSGNFTVNYYTQSGGDPTDILNPQNYEFSVDPGSQPQPFEVWVYAEISAYDESTDTMAKCYDEEYFQFTVYPRLLFDVEEGIICVDPETNQTFQSFVLEAGLDSSDFNVEWYLNEELVGIGLIYVAVEEGIYTAVPVKLTPEVPPDCNYAPVDVAVVQSSPAIASVAVTSPFEDVANAVVTIENGFGTYIYSLDEEEFQSGNEFFDLSSGEHVIVVRDVLGYCGDFTLPFTVIKYPKFFTPNGDTYNDTWNIWDLRDEYPDAIISIFDRYGKFLKQISPSGNGWDGMLNGKALPSTDYWFTVDYLYKGEQKKFKAHFALKR